MLDLFRNHIVGFPTKWLIYSLHHKQLKISFFMPPTLKKLEGHIAFGLSVCLSVCVCVCVR